MASTISLLAIWLKILSPYKRISTNLCSGSSSVFKVSDILSSRTDQLSVKWWQRKRKCSDILSSSLHIHIELFETLSRYLCSWRWLKPQPNIQAMLDKHFDFFLSRNIVWQAHFACQFQKLFACHKQKCLSRICLHDGQTDKHCAWQAKLEMFAKQCLSVWLGFKPQPKSR